jgi:hypothetical protein
LSNYLKDKLDMKKTKVHIYEKNNCSIISYEGKDSILKFSCEYFKRDLILERKKER